MGIGANIKKIANAKKISLVKLSELSGVSLNTIYSITKRDSNTANIDIIKKIALALEVPYTDLLDVDSDEFKQFKKNRKEFADKWNASIKSKKMNDLFNQLNEKGQEKAIDHVEMLTKIDEYKK